MLCRAITIVIRSCDRALFLVPVTDNYLLVRPHLVHEA